MWIHRKVRVTSVKADLGIGEGIMMPLKPYIKSIFPSILVGCAIGAATYVYAFQKGFKEGVIVGDIHSNVVKSSASDTLKLSSSVKLEETLKALSVCESSLKANTSQKVE